MWPNYILDFVSQSILEKNVQMATSSLQFRALTFICASMLLIPVWSFNEILVQKNIEEYKLIFIGSLLLSYLFVALCVKRNKKIEILYMMMMSPS